MKTISLRLFDTFTATFRQSYSLNKIDIFVRCIRSLSFSCKTDSDFKTALCLYANLSNPNKRGISWYKPCTDLSSSLIISLRWLLLGPLLQTKKNPQCKHNLLSKRTLRGLFFPYLITDALFCHAWTDKYTTVILKTVTWRKTCFFVQSWAPRWSRGSDNTADRWAIVCVCDRGALMNNTVSS